MAAENRAGQGPGRGEGWTAATGQAARWVAVDLDLRAPRTWLGPSWALLAGMVGSGAVPFQWRSLVILAVAWLVSEPLLGSLLALSQEIASIRKGIISEGRPVPRWTLPYLQPGAPGRWLLDGLAARITSIVAGWQGIGGAGERWLLLALLSVVLSAVVGGWVPLLILLSLAGLGLVALGKPLRAGMREALGAAHIFLAWLVGHSAFAGPDYRALLVGAAFAVIWYAWTRRPPLVRLYAVAHLLVVGLLLAGRAPLSAGGVLLLAMPPVVLWPEGPSSLRTYLPQTQFYLMASLLLAAWGLVWGF